MRSVSSRSLAHDVREPRRPTVGPPALRPRPFVAMQCIGQNIAGRIRLPGACPFHTSEKSCDAYSC